MTRASAPGSSLIRLILVLVMDTQIFDCAEKLFFWKKNGLWKNSTPTCWNPYCYTAKNRRNSSARWISSRTAHTSVQQIRCGTMPSCKATAVRSGAVSISEDFLLACATQRAQRMLWLCIHIKGICGYPLKRIGMGFTGENAPTTMGQWCQMMCATENLFWLSPDPKCTVKSCGTVIWHGHMETSCVWMFTPMSGTLFIKQIWCKSTKIWRNRQRHRYTFAKRRSFHKFFVKKLWIMRSHVRCKSWVVFWCQFFWRLSGHFSLEHQKMGRSLLRVNMPQSSW